MKSNGKITVSMHPRRIGHANLTVRDLDRSVKFYNLICGIEITGIEHAHGIDAGFLSNGNTHHDVGLVQKAGLPIGLNHFGWEMENELELVQAYRRMEQLGIEAERLTDQGTSRSVYLKAPDGSSHQFYADAIKDWRSVYTGGNVVLHGRPTWAPGDPVPTTDARYQVDPPLRRVDDALAHPAKIGRAVMLTTDMERALSFYTDTAGLEPFYRAPDGSLVCLRGSASSYDLALVADRERDGLERICFEMPNEEEVDLAEKAMRKAGQDIVRRQDDERKRGFVIRDPDGIPVELFRDREVDFGRLRSNVERLAIA
ncbi:MAG: hypothetical protein FJX53_11415 [Alphaproteobacteria bacterium]|nr:hypothetical protein [Alphaproteobacteria bacterium]